MLLVQNLARSIVGLLTPNAKLKAMNIFKETLAAAINAHKAELHNVNIVISEYVGHLGVNAANDISKSTHMDIGSILGDIKEQAQEGDLIINAWDPHSAPGNGNDGDNSFDGQIGRSTGILLTQTNWFNPALNDLTIYKKFKIPKEK